MSERQSGGIATPDRRVRVFVSSTLGELATERGAAHAAITGLRLTPVMFEMGARPHPPRELYRAYLAQSDVFVGMYWQRYGWVAPGESVSGLEDEYQLSGDRPKLMYVKAPAPNREPRLTELLHRVQADDRVSYKSFADATQLAELVSDDLAVLLTERFTAEQAEAPAGLRAARLPSALTPTIGRDADQAAVVDKIHAGARLVTVTGPGGVGKTRLALDVGAALAKGGTFEGVWFVDLAPVAEPSQLLGAIAAELGIQTRGLRPYRDVLADRLTGHPVLIVLDNFEHLIAAAPDLSQLLTMVPDLSLLVTSRTVLHLRGEQEWVLAPLPVPRPDDSAVADAAQDSPAAQLFLARARDARPGFKLTSADSAAITEICRRLDGIPLAIELAAARVRLLPPVLLLERLEGQLDISGGHVDLPERQRTLRSTLDWSYELLNVAERSLLAQLSVFASGWTVDAAEYFGTGSAPEPLNGVDVVSTLSSLIDKSWVIVDDSGSAGPRFRMLGAVREYAAERLDEHGQRQIAMERLLEITARFVAEAAEGLCTTYRWWATRLDDELDNVRAALRYAVESDHAEGAYSIAFKLGYYLWSRSLLAEVLALIDDIRALPSAASLDELARGRLLWGRAATSIEMGRLEGTRSALQEALEIGHALGDIDLIVRAHTGLSYLADGDEVRRSREALEEGVRRLRQGNDLASAAYALAALGQLTLRDNDLAAAEGIIDEGRRLAEQMENDHLEALALHQLGFIALLNGAPSRAIECFEASLAANGNLRDQEGLSYCLDGFAAVAQTQQQMVAATRLHGAAAHRRAVLGIDAWRVLVPILSEQVNEVRQALGETRFEQEWAAGAKMQPVEAIAVGREVVRGLDVSTAPGSR